MKNNPQLFIKNISLIKEYMSATGKSYVEIRTMDVYQGVKIGEWKKTQRFKYKNGELSEEETNILTELGEDFYTKSHKGFEQTAQLIKEYLNETGKTYQEIRPNVVYKGVNIGTWKQTQRARYKSNRLNNKEIIVLNNLGEDFTIKTIKHFEERANLIKEYLKETNKTYQDIKADDEYKSFMVGWWKKTQRTRYKRQELSKKEIEILRSLGEDFNIRDIRSFKEMVVLIKEYLVKYNKTYQDIKTNEEYQGINIAAWKRTQRTRYKNQNLSEEEKNILSSLGEDFNVKDVRSFEEMVYIMLIYMYKTGKTYNQIHQSDTYEGIHIGLWKVRQRMNYKNKKLTEQQIIALTNLGENFDIRDMKSFEEMVYIVLIYMHKTGKTYDQIRQCDTYEGINIGFWKRRQRVEYKEGKLTDKQIIALNNLGEDFRPLKIRKTVSNAKLEKNLIPKLTISGEKTKKLL